MNFFLKRGWENRIVQILFAQSLPNLSVRHPIAQSLRSLLTPSSHSLKPSEKKPSALSNSSYSDTDSSNASYFSVSECRNTAEHAKLAARQVEERAQRQIKLLEQLFEHERQKNKEEVLVARENATLVEHQNLLNECLPKEVKGWSLSAQSQSSNGFGENLIQKWVNNSRAQYSLI